MLYPFLSKEKYCNNYSTDSCLLLKPTKNLSHSFNKFNTFSFDINIPKN